MALLHRVGASQASAVGIVWVAFLLPLICRDRNKEASYPQSHGGAQGLEDLGGQMEEGVGIGYPSPRDADDGVRVLRTLLGVGGTEGVLQQG